MSTRSPGRSSRHVPAESTSVRRVEPSECVTRPLTGSCGSKPTLALLVGNRSPTYLRGMADVTQILDAAAAGDPQAAAELLPLVYDELRKLAAARLADERPGQTLQATALVHEAYLRLVGGRPAATGTAGATSSPPPPRPCAASSSKRPAARRRLKRGGGRQRVDLDADDLAAAGRPGRGPARPGRGPRPAGRGRPGRGRAGQAPLLRRADARGGRRGASASPRRPPTATGPSPGPGCTARPRRRTARAEKPSRPVMFPAAAAALAHGSGSTRHGASP